MSSFQQEYVRCGKKGCKSCPHGPYWYEYWREGERVRKKYHGKADPRPGRAGEGHTWPRDRPPDHPHDRIYCRQTASVGLANEILGLSGRETKDDAKRKFNVLVLKHHPDRGGDRDVMARVNAAWSYLKAAKGW